MRLHTNINAPHTGPSQPVRGAGTHNKPGSTPLISEQAESRQIKFAQTYCQAAAIAATSLGILALLGSVFHIVLFVSVFPGMVTTKVNSALCLVFTGITLWLLIPRPPPGPRDCRGARSSHGGAGNWRSHLV